MISKIICSILMIIFLSSSATAQIFNNDSVVALHRAGLKDSAIIAKIDISPCNFDTSTKQIIVLSHLGVSEEVIVAMVERCAGSRRAQGVSDNASDDPQFVHAPGIYLQESAGALTLLRPTQAAGLKFTGLGSIVFPKKAKLVVPQPSAQLRTPLSRPVFWFYFDPTDRKVSDFGTTTSIAAQSPNEFSLVRFQAVDGNRQFSVGRVEPYVQIVGIETKTTIPFSILEKGDGIFMVQLTEDLPQGEYAFVLPGKASAFRIYDFSITPR